MDLDLTHCSSLGLLPSWQRGPCHHSPFQDMWLCEGSGEWEMGQVLPTLSSWTASSSLLVPGLGR